MFQALPFAVEGLGSLVIGLLGQPVETHLRLVALLALPFLAAGLFRWLES